MRLSSFFILLILTAFTHAYSNTDEKNETGYIDQTHHYLSQKVLYWSETIDTQLNSWLTDDTNHTSTSLTKTSHTIEDKAVSVDSFFQNEKFLEETGSTYVRLRTDTLFEKGTSPSMSLTFSAQLPLTKSKENLKVFIDDLTQENILRNNRSGEKLSTSEIGLHYFLSYHYNIQSKYSLALRGLDPFIRARYSMPHKIYSWLVEPMQQFRYSIKDEFEEESNIYFDKVLQEDTLFRIQLHRKSTSQSVGMDYGLSLHYFWKTDQNMVFKLSQSFWGNTDYRYILNTKAPTSQTESFSGINNYVTSLSLRGSIWRKWLFYELVPSVNFPITDDYKARYTLRFFFDFHFGKCR